MPEPVLTVSGLYKHFGGVVATDYLGFDVADGEIHAIIGPNGAGKTTLINQLSGFIRCDAGRMVFAGQDVTGLTTHERARLGLVRSYQITSVFRRYSVEHNLALAILAGRGSSVRFWTPLSKEMELWAQARAVAHNIGLADRLGVLAGKLAHGEQRQLEVGLALATGARVLLLDEPMAGLSPNESQRMVTLIEGLKSSAAVILVEHDMDAVFRLAQRISVLVSGRIIATDTPDRIRANPEVQRAYLGDGATV
jgi:branched-chain amino acid transport system ATP-binding protein